GARQRLGKRSVPLSPLRSALPRSRSGRRTNPSRPTLLLRGRGRAQGDRRAPEGRHARPERIGDRRAQGHEEVGREERTGGDAAQRSAPQRTAPHRREEGRKELTAKDAEDAGKTGGENHRGGRRK